MARYSFDIHEGSQVHRDDEGQELPDLEAVRKMAMDTLVQIAYDQIPKDGDRQVFVVLVTDEDGKAVYSATLGFAGQWLLR